MAHQLPQTSPPWLGAARKRAPYYVLLALLLAGLAGILTYGYLKDLQHRMLPNATAVVASRGIRAGELLDPDALELRTVPVGVLPQGALTDIGEAQGMFTSFPLRPGEILLDRDVDRRQAGPVARLKEDSWAVVLPVNWLMSPLPGLELGDRLDLVAYQSGEPIMKAGLIVEDVEIIGQAGGEVPPSQVVLSVNREEVIAIMYARANGFNLLALVRPRRTLR
jgi:Flp pilus assembly protein CpaB